MKMAERFLDRHGADYVLIEGSQTARFLQSVVGDLIARLPHKRRYWAIEVKTERTNRHGNIFVEWFSNRNLEDKDNHGFAGTKMGWFAELRADLLWYQFLDEEEIHVYDLFALQRWALWTPRGDRDRPNPRLFDYPLKPEGQTDQKNDTWGFCVPIRDICEVPSLDGARVPYRKFHPAQYELFRRGLAA